MKSELIYEDDGAKIVVVRNVTFVLWKETPTLEALAGLEKARAHCHAKNPDGAGLMNIVYGTTPRFTPDIRREAKRQGETPLGTELGGCQVILTPGLAGTAIRTFISGTLLFSAARAHRAVFSDLPSGAAWLAPRVGWDPKDLIMYAHDFGAP